MHRSDMAACEEYLQGGLFEWNWTRIIVRAGFEFEDMAQAPHFVASILQVA